MDLWQPFIPFSSKSYNKYGRIILAVTFVLAAILIGVGYDLKEKDDFRCNPNKTIAADLVAKNFVTTQCYISYEKEHHPSIPVSRFVVINFGLILLISVTYAGVVNAKVEKLDTKFNENMEEPWQLESLREANVFVFPLYIMHLIARVAPLILFIVLFSSANFPVKFQCPWPPHSKESQTATVECVNPLGKKFETLATSVFLIDIFIVVIAVVEILYLRKRYKMDKDFGNDTEFCYIYLLEKRNITIRQILKGIRKKVTEDEHFSKVMVNSGFKPYRGSYTLDDLRFQFLVHEQIESKSETRHEIYNVYLDREQDSVKNRLVNFLSLKDYNNHGPFSSTNNPDSTATAIDTTTNSGIPQLHICNKVLVVGRAGIGKTTFAKTLFYLWAKCALLENRVVFLLTFRRHKKDKPTTLKKMLHEAKGMPSDLHFEDLYQFILTNPKKTVLIFDGLDNIETSSDEQEEDTTDDYQKSMPMFSIFIKLFKDQLLPGATVLTTSRRGKAENVFNDIGITFQKRLELLGFSEHDIENYVKGFCPSETDNCANIWKTIKNNPEFLNLCYVPQVCDLVCLTLKECFEQSKTDKDIAIFLPKTITELYQRAIRVIIWETLRYRWTSPFGTRGYLTSEMPRSSSGYMETLKRLAKCKLESEEPSFKIEAKDKSQQIISCGLVTPLTEGCYRFLHITMQEFLAAHQIVDQMKDTGDVMQFLSSLNTYLDEPKWHLVVQFVFGLLGEKMRKKKLEIPKQIIFRSLLQWIRFLTPYKEMKDAKKTGRKPRIPNNNEKKVAILVIKFLHEIQDVEMMKICGTELEGGGPNNVCYLNGLDIVSIDCVSLLQFLVFVKFLTKLTLSDNDISDLGCLGLANLLNENAILTQVSLIRASLGDEGMKILCDNITPKNRRPANFHLGVNRITAKGVECLCDAIVAKKLNIIDLSLNINSIMADGAKALGKAFTHSNCNITKLNLYKCEIGNRGVIALFTALQHENCNLVDVDLSNNNINYEGVRGLCDLLNVQRTQLTRLALRRNNLTARDIEPLCELLRSNNGTLTNLDLSANQLGDPAAEFLYRGLTGTNSSTLENLFVGRNEMKERGIKILSDALKISSCNLKRLSLVWSQIGDVGMKHICDALKNGNCKLTSLDLSCNEISHTGLRYLCEALQSNHCKIVNLQLCSNNLTDQDRKRLNDSFNVAARQNPNRGRLVTIT